MAEESQSRLLDTWASARLLGVSRETLLRRIRSGELRASVVSGSLRRRDVRILEDDLKQYVSPELSEIRVAERESVAVVYVILLVPELSSRRLKIGFARSVNNRLKQHRTACPTAKLLRCWIASFNSESGFLALARSMGLSSVGSSAEVFDCENIPALLEAGDSFFGMQGENVDDHAPNSNVCTTVGSAP